MTNPEERERIYGVLAEASGKLDPTTKGAIVLIHDVTQECHIMLHGHGTLPEQLEIAQKALFALAGYIEMLKTQGSYQDA